MTQAATNLRTPNEIIRALKAEPFLMTMIAEEIGERAMIEPDDMSGGATWETIGADCLWEMQGREW